MEEYRKKGQVTNVVSGVVALIAGMGVATLVLIFVGALGGQTYNLVEPDINSIGNTSVTNQAWTPLNATSVSFGYSPVHSGSLLIHNGTEFVGLGNFTIDYTAGTGTLTNAAYNNTAMSINYTWGDTTIRGHVKDGIVSSFKALEQTGNYLPIIVLAIVISVVLALVLGMAGATMGGYGKGTAL